MTLLDTEDALMVISAMVVCGQTFTDEIISRVQSVVVNHPDISRADLSRRVCEWLNWRSPSGALREVACRTALLKLHRQHKVELPAPQPGPPRPNYQKTTGQAETACSPPMVSLSSLGTIELLIVPHAKSQLSDQWNDLIRTYHYLGCGPLCGAQLRYLIHSSTQGWLGGLSFSAASWQLKSRDRWIGWSPAARRKNLQLVVCNSRFLIVPTLRAPNLASHVLSRCTEQLAGDWKQRYGYAPVLCETFVDTTRFSGTCYQAANWIRVGETTGRGRQDAERKATKPIKDVYLYPLTNDAKARLCCEPPRPVIMRSETDWAEAEFGGAQFGDQRLGKRLVSLAHDFFARPQANIPQACQTRAKTKAAYRFLEHGETTMEKIIAPHYEATLGRIQHEKIALAVQDTTSLNYSTRHATTGLGPISDSNTVIGLEVHDTMAFNLEGTPLGLLNLQVWAREPLVPGERKPYKNKRPREERESRKWFESYRAVADMQRRLPTTRLVSVSDRESDIYELFELALADQNNPWLLVRAVQSRRLADEEKNAWEYMAEQEVAGVQELSIPRKGVRKARTAKLAIRFSSLEIKEPKNRLRHRTKQQTLFAVVASEIETPAGVESLEWKLLTTKPVESFSEATEVLGWYTKRWGIEVFHRILKSGCNIEERQLGNADSIEACLAIDAVVAWRVFHLTKLGRETPEVPCTVAYEEAEWKAVVAYQTGNPVAPAQTPTLNQMNRRVASLGGFLGRKSDGNPGTQTMWLGLQRLDDLAGMWCVMTGIDPPGRTMLSVSSGPTYG
jgi:hypothetical protein